MSFRELERLSRGYVRAISQIVGPTKDIPAPDVFTNANVTRWTSQLEDLELNQFQFPGFITGKPLVLKVVHTVVIQLQQKGLQLLFMKRLRKKASMSKVRASLFARIR